jgi:membrane protease YdiL (CAAX protease family)
VVYPLPISLNNEQAISAIVLFILILFGIYLFVYAHRHKQRYPWNYALFLLGVVIKNGTISITFNGDIHIGLIWFLLIPWIYSIRSNFDKYLLINDNMIRGTVKSAILGLLLGLVLFLAYYLYSAIILGTVNQVSNLWVDVPLLRLIERVIAEEFLFRSFLLGTLIAFGFRKSVSNFIQSSLFTAAHLSVYISDLRFFELGIVMLLGLLAGYITYRYKNLFGAILMHAVLNYLWNIFLS